MGDPQLHRLVDGFRGVAEDYELGRPAYPPSYVEALGSEAGLVAPARVLDLGAGTGKLARPLVAAGFDLVAVEPLPEMRTALAAAIGSERVLEGSAEQLPLEDGSVDGVVCGDAFHWFDGARATRELHRVLRAQAPLLISFLVPDVPRAPGWARQVEARLAPRRGSHPAFTADRGLDALVRDGGFAPRRQVELRFEHLLSVEQLQAYVGSFSYVGAMGHAAREELLDELAAIVRDEPLPLRLPMLVELWISRRLP